MKPVIFDARRHGIDVGVSMQVDVSGWLSRDEAEALVAELQQAVDALEYLIQQSNDAEYAGLPIDED